MRVSIGFSGAAGTGVNTSGMFLGDLLSKKGYTIMGDKEYASIIKGDNNDFFLYISHNEHFISQKIDYFFAFDDYAIKKNEKIYKLKKKYNVKNQKVKYKNVFCFGAALKILGIDIQEGKSLLEAKFSGEILDINIDCLEKGYAYIKEVGTRGKEKEAINLSSSVGPEKKFMFGNEIVANGAMESGMDFYAAYPMTPASSIIDVVTERIAEDGKEGKHDIEFFQGEDELAVGLCMLGAKYTGRRSMCGTSGGGFALMSEGISFSNQAEIGGVYVLSQRDGPSTGTPTFTGQADLNFALNASFGDTFPIVLAPSSYEDGYPFIGKALNRSDQYQHPVVYITDKQFAESYLSVDTSALKAEPINRGKIRDEKSKYNDEYKRYAFTDDGISPVVLPGTEGGESMITSYEHDEYGATNEAPDIKELMMKKRFKKLETFQQEVFTDDFYGYDIVNPEAQIFFVTRGMNRYVLEDYIRMKNEKGKTDMKKYGLIVIKVFQPLDMRLKTFLDEHIKKIKKLIFVEMNFSGQMQEFITNKCLLNDKKWIKKISNIRKYTCYPIFLEDIKA